MFLTLSYNTLTPYCSTTFVPYGTRWFKKLANLALTAPLYTYSDTFATYTSRCIRTPMPLRPCSLLRPPITTISCPMFPLIIRVTSRAIAQTYQERPPRLAVKSSTFSHCFLDSFPKYHSPWPRLTYLDYFMRATAQNVQIWNPCPQWVRIHSFLDVMLC
jgi:hypothetical protein